MNRPTAILAKALLFLSAAALATADAAAQSYKVETATLPAPQELAAPVRDALSADALRVTGPQGPLCEIWLRKDLPASATPNQALGIAFSQFAEGAMVGAIRLHAPAKDYRQQAIKPGVYTLRYALQPVDGNHQGVSPYRDYFLAVPAATDFSLTPRAGKDLYAASRKASGTGHPSVWSLVPGDNAPTPLPAMAHQEDGDLWVLYVKLPLVTPGGASPIVVGLILVGHAPEAWVPLARPLLAVLSEHA